MQAAAGPELTLCWSHGVCVCVGVGMSLVYVFGCVRLLLTVFYFFYSSRRYFYPKRVLFACYRVCVCVCVRVRVCVCARVNVCTKRVQSQLCHCVVRQMRSQIYRENGFSEVYCMSVTVLSFLH